MNYQTKNVLCPFYVRDDKRSITCEGQITSTSTNFFGSASEKRVHFYKYCCKDYLRCEHEKNIEKKYNAEVT